MREYMSICMYVSTVLLQFGESYILLTTEEKNTFANIRAAGKTITNQ